MTFLKYDINLSSPLLNIFSQGKRLWENMVCQAWCSLDTCFHSMVKLVGDSPWQGISDFQ